MLGSVANERLLILADELYALTPDEFTATRNQRAKEARTDDKDLGNAIKALPKPSTAAWVVNLVARNEADLLTQVVELGESLRDAQEKLAGDDLRELARQRRQLTGAVTSRARRLANDLGVRISESVATQVEETLRAAMTDEGAARAVRSGQLVEALSATGVDSLDVSTAVAVPQAIGMTARPVERKKPQLTVVEDEPESAEEEGARVLEEAREAADEAEAAAGKARKKLDKRAKRVAELEARSLQLQGDLEEVRRRAGELEHELETVDDELSAAEEKRARAEQKNAAARAAVESARAVVERAARP